jgi:hypothetical protein
MSKNRTHIAIGTVAGGASVRGKAQQQRPENIVLEVVGGLVAGNLAARLPDVFDPPLHPDHRSVAAHAFVPLATAGMTARGYCSHIAFDAVTSAGLPLLA